MALSTTYFDPLSLLSPKSPNFAMQMLVFSSKHTVPVIRDAHCAKFFYTTWVRGVAYHKQLSGPKLMGVWAKGACKNLGPLFISATVEANNFKFGIQLGFGE